MSIDIDMQQYMGATHPAAVDNSVDTNSYQQEQQDYLPPQELPEQPQADALPQEVEKNPQSEHFRALREEVDRIKAEKEADKREYQLQLDMFRANLAQQQRAQEPAPRKMFDGMRDDDVPSVAELRREWEIRETNYKERLEELQVQQMHPDYAEVINKYLVPLVKQKPYLAEGIQGASNKSQYAYELAKMAQQAYEPREQAPVQSENARRIVENARKPGTLSQAGGQGALSKADYFESMSDQEFMRFAGKNLDQI